MIQLDKKYDPKQVEEHWGAFWLDNKLYHADETLDRETYSIVIPPPNITGSLHIGHAFNNTLQDILIRWKRMSGFNTLWQPGTDHAGIATQNVVERQLHAEGTHREALGREDFIKRVWRWRDESGGTIGNQLRKLGCSLDWERDRFTMDEGLSRAVREVFVSLYEEGLIYQGDYIINWCPRCHTALSDLEVEHEDTKGHLYNIKYKFKDEDRFLTVATTRPETMLGDSAVAVNGTDERYQGLTGKTLLLPLVGREIPLIEDSYVDASFGSGALKVTPAHDPNDFEIGQRHQLAILNVMNPDGTMNELAGPDYQGLDRYDCRKKLVADLEAKGLLAGIEDHMHSVGHCYRCQTVVEPYLSKQWFVKAKPLAEPAIAAVRSGAIQIVPQFWEKTYFEWMENIRDWCISRQIWWGHQIPAWHCSECKGITVVRVTPETCSQCGSKDIVQETDVLDTWFSSALWPFSTLGWPDQTETLKKFYPTSVLCTGFDILFFWVARMAMMGLKMMKEIPFQQVYIHALIRDADGQKMSKTKGNVIDPLVMMEKYGTDALRFTLAAFAAQGRDIKLAEERIEGYRNFCNKLWNASRFAFMNLEGYQGTCELNSNLTHSRADRWILSRLNSTCRDVNTALEEFKFNEAAAAVYKFIWNEFCDWYIELSKSSLFKEGPEKPAVQNVLVHVLETSLKLLHPFMPFITEEIWQKLPAEGTSIMNAPFPKFDITKVDEKIEEEQGLVMDIVTSVRNIRGEMNLNPGLTLPLLIKTEDVKKINSIRFSIRSINELARVTLGDIGGSVVKPKVAASSVLDGMDLIIPLDGIMDFAEEQSRVEKELKKIEKDLIFLGKKLSNQSFVAKAPPDIIEKDKQRKLALSEKQSKLKAHLQTIGQTTS
ncbi:MAG: valine--tRNA ligase [Nitrospinae bacterium]|jgi:valyl-tRNA synthetase|nr:valine--tRNA ligase [Nitrospinota bacterium]MDA1110413.1 valine--tRNA ligase [Nitrospinota bacterium]